MAVGIIPSGNAKHAVIARSLANDISLGIFPVGTILPSEQDLSNRFEVSRHTVRMALRTLQELGLVTSQPGIGSMVRATRSESQYTQSFSSVKDLLQYTRTTRFETMERYEVVADSDFSSKVGGKPGEKWWHLYMVRAPKESNTPVTVADVFVPYAVGIAIGAFPNAEKPIFEQIQDIGETIVEIKQEIAAAMPSEKEACLLNIQLNTPVLVIVRRYFGERGRLLEVTRTVHPADSFAYSMKLRLGSNRAPQ